jgi:Ca-activated chloride channel family protein
VRTASAAYLFFCCSSLASASAWELPKLTDPEVGVRYGSAILAAQGPFIAIEQNITLHNSHDRTLEANLNLELPQGQRLRGYALDINGKLRDASVVDRVKGRVAFEEITRRQIDPALVEQRPGNNYSIRVFPVLAKGQRQLRLDLSGLATRKDCGWETTLSREFVSRLIQPKSSGLVIYSEEKPSAFGLKVSPLNGKRNQWSLSVKNSKATSDVQFCVPAPKSPNQVSWKTVFDGQLHFVEALAPATGKRKLPSKLELVWDNSLSMQGRKIDDELALISQYVANRDVDIQLTVLGQDRTSPQNFRISQGDVRALTAYLSQLTPDGATRLSAWKPSPVAQEVLMFTDATNTWPDDSLVNASVMIPVHVVTSFANTDMATIRYLTRWGGQSINLMKSSVNEALKQLTQQGAAWRLPPVMPAQRPGHGWHAASLGADQGVLRACVIGDDPKNAQWIDAKGGSHTTQLRQAKDLQIAMAREMIFWCATWAAEDMAISHPQMSTTRAEFAKQYEIVTDETSLIVLEQASDYVRYGIMPLHNQPELRAKVEQSLARINEDKARQLEAHKQTLAKSWSERKAWWAKSFPKNGPRPKAEPRKLTIMDRLNRLSYGSSRQESAVPMVAAAPAAYQMSADDSGRNSPRSNISLQLQPDTGALNQDDARFAQALTAEQVEAVYLDTRNAQMRNVGYFLRVADRFYALGDTACAERVLSNLVELAPAEHAVLRLVAYRLQQANPLSPELLSLFKRIVHLAPEEPASHRDLAMALADQGQCDLSANVLAHVVNTPWPSRFPDVSVIALAELNAMVETCRLTKPLSIAPELMTNLPVDLRVVLTWNVKDTDIDLHITDPNNEETFFGARESYQGGAMSRDSTAGNGPEEFILRNPIPGDYKVSVKFYGSNQARLVRDATIKLQFQTGFGTPQVKTDTRVINLLPGSDTQLVGTFSVGPTNSVHGRNKAKEAK